MVRAIVVTGYGINCEYETAHAFELAGAEAEKVHINRLGSLDDYQILAVPGGFSFGDDISAGKMLAQKLKMAAEKEIEKFIADGKLVIGICNGFQALVKYALLPEVGEQSLTLTFNESGRFEDRWVPLKPEGECVWTKGIEELYLPVRHGEGKLVAPKEVIDSLEAKGLVALRYGHGYPDNPNGSTNDIAGICDASGRVFGLMPHPEGHLYRTNHPRWTRGEQSTLGLEVFKNAVKYAEAKL
ncbi:phosphoribosylformylglycinamidine synthase I [archaeon]